MKLRPFDRCTELVFCQFSDLILEIWNTELADVIERMQAKYVRMVTVKPICSYTELNAFVSMISEMITRIERGDLKDQFNVRCSPLLETPLAVTAHNYLVMRRLICIKANLLTQLKNMR